MYDRMDAVKEYIKHILPNLEDEIATNLLETIKDLGVTESDDLSLIHEEDLKCSRLTLIQCRKLLKAFQCQSSREYN